MTTRMWFALAIGVALFVGWSIYSDRSHAATENGLRAIIARNDSMLKQLSTRIGKTDSIFVTDTVTLTKARTVFRTRVDSIRRTETLTVRERAIVAAADTTNAACNLVVLTCEQRVAQRDSAIVLYRQQAHDQAQRALLAATPRRFTPWAEALYSFAPSAGVAGRAGADVRLFGRLSATAFAFAQQGQSLRALVGARFTF